MPEQPARGKTGPDPLLADPAKRQKILKRVKKGASLKKAIELVGIHDLKTLASYRRRDPDFDEQIREAEGDGFDFHLNNYTAMAAGQIGDQDVRLAAVRLKASIHYLSCKDPEGWAARKRHEVTGANGGPVETHTSFDLSKCSDADLERLGDVLPRIVVRGGDGAGAPGGE